MLDLILMVETLAMLSVPISSTLDLKKDIFHTEKEAKAGTTVALLSLLSRSTSSYLQDHACNAAGCNFSGLLGEWKLIITSESMMR
jgi:hypothetical protein